MEFDSLILALAALLFAIAVVSLIVWAFKTFVLGRSSSANFLRTREKRLGVVETASVDGRRSLLLVRRDDVEHLLIVGGPVDLVIETGIKGRPHLGAPLDDVIIAKNETRTAPDFGKS
jgi:flagellar protein FliO/FliZ